jgi:16S rRNA processing protein RimM
MSEAVQECRPEELVAVGSIGKSTGLKGAMYIYPSGATLTPRSKGWYRVGHNPQEAEPLYLEQLNGSLPRYIGRFRGVEDRAHADKLRAMILYLAQKQLPDLDSSEFYHFELEGMTVYDEHNQLFGTVVSVNNYPTLDALDIRRTVGEMVTVPLDKERVSSIDRHQRTIHIDSSQLADLL